MVGGVDATSKDSLTAWYAASSPVDLLLRYRDAMACRIAHRKSLPSGFDHGLFEKVDAAATRSICAAFQGGVLSPSSFRWLCSFRIFTISVVWTGMDATAETRTLALQLAVGRFLNHVLDVMEYDGGQVAAGHEIPTPPWAAIDNHPSPPPGSPDPRLFLYSGKILECRT
jgi:hypothetical protein